MTNDGIPGLTTLGTDEGRPPSAPSQSEVIDFITIAGWFLHRWYVIAVTVPVVMAALIVPAVMKPDTYTSSAVVYARPGGPDSRFLAEIFRSIGTGTVNAYVGDNAPQIVRATAPTSTEAQQIASESIQRVSNMLLADRPDYKAALTAAQARYDATLELDDTALALLALQEVGRAEVAYQAGLEPPLRIVREPSLPVHANPKASYANFIVALFVAGLVSAGLIVAIQVVPRSWRRRSTP